MLRGGTLTGNKGIDRRCLFRGGRRATGAARMTAWAALLICMCASSARAQMPTGWSTSTTKILAPTSGEFMISGINWYGFETKGYVAHGLWTKDYRYVLDEIKQYGYSTIRLPYSNQMWESNPAPAVNQISACTDCSGKRARDIMAMIVNYAGSIGLHVILDNHRSNAGNSAQESGLWYTSGYSEQAWIRDWVSVQEWTHGIQQALGAPDTIIVNTFASDGLPTVLGFDLRNEPHTATGGYLNGSTWGSGDGINPAINPNPNPFTPACVATSSCHDWRLAAERAADTILGEASKNGWPYPLIFVEGVSQYLKAGGNATSGPYDGYWWGGNLLGVNGNSTNPGAPVVLNAGGDAAALGVPVYNQLVYSAHDYGPDLYRQSWFNSGTCYATGCSSSSLADIWKKYWAHVNLPGGINPVWPGQPVYPWANTGHTAVIQAPVYIGEFGTANRDADLYTSGAGSQGQWTTSIVNFIQSSYLTTKTALNDSGVPVSDLHWTYWAVNDEDNYAVLGANYTGLENPKKEYSFLCFIQQGLLAVPMGSGTGQCGSTGTLPLPDSSAPPVVVPATPTGLVATAGDAQVSLTWSAVTGATAYTVKSSTTSGGPYQTVQAGILSTSFVHAGLTNGVTYYDVVSATNSAGESADSSQVSATPAPAPVTPPPAPTGLTATAGDAQVQLTWAAVTAATGYNVKFSTTSDGPYQTAASGISATTFTHTGLTNGTTYYYVVSAAGSAGESTNSNQVSATPLAPGQTMLSIWSPTDGATLTGTLAFKARMENMALADYRMYWQVDGGKLNPMSDNNTGGPHKEASVDVTTWTWHGNGPYIVNFVAKDRRNRLIMQKSVTIYVAH